MIAIMIRSHRVEYFWGRSHGIDMLGADNFSVIRNTRRNFKYSSARSAIAKTKYLPILCE